MTAGYKHLFGNGERRTEEKAVEPEEPSED